MRKPANHRGETAHVRASADAAHQRLGARLALAAARDAGITTETVLADTALIARGIDRGQADVTAADEQAIATNLVRAVGDPVRAGILAGSRMTIGDLGIWGYALITSNTCGEAVTLAVRFASLSPTRLSPQQDTANDAAVIRLHDEHLEPGTRDYFAARDLAALSLLLRTAGLHDARLSVETRFRAAGAAQLRKVLAPTSLIAGAPHHGFRAPVEMLDHPLPTADPVTRDACLRECERLIHEHADRGAITPVVRSRLALAPNVMPTIDDLADELHMGTRTLRRRLTREGTSYRQIRDDVACALAVELLGTVGLTVAETAHRLGYSDPASFSHAFRRWIGHNPGEYRPDTRTTGPLTMTTCRGRGGSQPRPRQS